MNWIDSKKQLPNSEEYVLIYSNNEVWIGYYNGVWNVDEYGMPVTVDYWLPLPEPPTESKRPNTTTSIKL